MYCTCVSQISLFVDSVLHLNSYLYTNVDNVRAKRAGGSSCTRIHAAPRIHGLRAGTLRKCSVQRKQVSIILLFYCLYVALAFIPNWLLALLGMLHCI